MPSWLLNISNVTPEHRDLGGGARNAGCFAMCRAVDQRGISPCPTQHPNIPPDIHVGKNSACNCLSREQNYILHISATYFLHDFKCIFFFFFCHKSNYCENCSVFLRILPRTVLHFRKTLLMAPCTCLLQFAFLVLNANYAPEEIGNPV